MIQDYIPSVGDYVLVRTKENKSLSVFIKEIDGDYIVGREGNKNLMHKVHKNAIAHIFSKK